MQIEATVSYEETKLACQALLTALSRGLYEREEAVRLALLSAIAGESIFLLGPPGVGKSLIARRLKYAFKDGVSFEYLMSKFSTPDEIFGPVSIKKLRDEDTYERNTDRYLPGANIVFLDEIWKAGPAIQNALLTILNEKIYRNGHTDIKVDIRAIITASNELPPNNSNVSPIWDRFLLRLEVGNIRKFSNFLDMITDTSDVYVDDIDPALKLSKETLDMWTKEIDTVNLPAEVLNTIQVLKIKLDNHNIRLGGAGHPIQIHDRRWKKSIRLLRTAAFLNGREAVNLMDCFLLRHTLWNHPDQKDIIQRILTETIRQHGYTTAVNMQMIKKELSAFEEEVESEIRIKHIVTEEALMPIEDTYYQLIKQDNKIEGAYITIKQYRDLSIDDVTVVNVFDNDKNLVNRLKAKKSPDKDKVILYHDAQEHTYPLKTRKVNRTEIIDKTPHPIILKHWDRQYQQLSKYIEHQLDKMDKETPAEMQTLSGNLFVEDDLVEVVVHNYNEVREQLKNMALQLEKLQYAYTNI